MSGSIRVEDGLVVLTVADEVDMATCAEYCALLDEEASVGAPRVSVEMAGGQVLDTLG